MRQTAGGWRIVDVLAMVRLAGLPRSAPNTLAARRWGGPGLLVSLRRKTAELSGGILQ